MENSKVIQQKNDKLKENKMNNKTNLLWAWIIFITLLFPLKETCELKMTKNEENNLNMLIKEIGDSNKLKENKDEEN